MAPMPSRCSASHHQPTPRGPARGPDVTNDRAIRPYRSQAARGNVVVDPERSRAEPSRDRINGWSVQRSHQRTARQRLHQRQMAKIPPGCSLFRASPTPGTPTTHETIGISTPLCRLTTGPPAMTAHDPGVRHGGGGPQTPGEPHRPSTSIDSSSRSRSGCPRTTSCSSLVRVPCANDWSGTSLRTMGIADVIAILACEASPPLTDRQLIAWLRHFAGADPRRRTVGAY